MRKSSKIRNLTVVKRSNKIGQALNLPKVLNLNPRSIYNKAGEFVTFVEEENVDLICMSESWEREELTLDELIKIDDFSIISNVYQRKGKGGRPAIFANTRKFHVENLTQSTISIPWGVEVVWAILTPKNVSNVSKIQKIVVGSIYSKPDSRKKSLLLDHISEVYHLLSSKYRKGLHWILAGDTNDLNLSSILDLNSKLKQCVQQPTRLNPPRMIDPIITTLSDYYQLPQCLPPLDADPDLDGKPSDHLMVVMSPVSVINNRPARITRTVAYRPFSGHKLLRMEGWVDSEDWAGILNEEDANRKMTLLQQMMVSKYHYFFPNEV